MRIEIDQSGKIEDTSKNTIIAFSNGCFCSIMIKAREKREIQKIFRKIGKKRIFVYKTFSVLIFLLIKNYLNKIDQIVVDIEYQGNEGIIKNFLLKEIRKVRSDFQKENIIFRGIGKKSRAHFLAYGVAIGKKSADMEVSAKDVLRFIK